MVEYYVIIILVVISCLALGCLVALHLEDKRINQQMKEYYRGRQKEDKERAEEIRKNSPVIAAIVDGVFDILTETKKK